MPTTQSQSRLPRTHIRVVRSDGREWPNITIALRELMGTATEISPSESQRIRLRLRGGETSRDRHGFTWSSVGGTVSEQTITWSDFTFGTEIELTMPIPNYEVARLLERNGFARWNVVHDGSVAAPVRGTYGMEVVSPVLQGADGLEEVKRVMDFLRANGGKVNRSCGLHVHIGVRGMKISRLRKIAAAFLNAEAAMDELMPPARLNNRYCQSNGRFHGGNFGRLESAGTVNAIAEAMNGGHSTQHYTHHRYYKLNFQSFVRHGTIEFRQHSGTVESEKACAWIRLVASFCAAAASASEMPARSNVSLDQLLSCVNDEAVRSYLRAHAAKFAALRAAA